MSRPSAPGKIVTFYSYKGGTGRSMALANVAWILASNGLRVLVIDWDLEAPGLHRYLHPFLDDPELTSSPGLIDYFVDVTVAARHAVASAPGGSESWWHAWTSFRRYSYSIEWEFPGAGTIDLVPAGRQGAAYAERVSSFHWTDFYEKLGGGVLLEALKRDLRRDYDYVLIDSRTGISDTAGICTVQMPDELVVCFTLNQQSVKGAAAAADSAWTQRLKPNGEPGLRIWPVPTRIELAEKEKLEAAIATAHTTFQRYIMHLPRDERARYWEQVQVLYQPFFAYEEILAPFVEKRRGSTGAMVVSMEAIAGAITGDPRIRLAAIAESRRLDAVARYAGPVKRPSAGRRRVFLHYASIDSVDRDAVEGLASALKNHGFIASSALEIAPGEVIADAVSRLISESVAMVYVLGGGRRSNEPEFPFAYMERFSWIPILVGDASTDPDMPVVFRTFRWADLRGSRFAEGFAELLGALENIAKKRSVDVDPDDPQKGQWGGRSAAGGRTLSASISEIANSWYSIDLEVSATGEPPLAGDVVFHLHPSFPDAVCRVPVVDGQAILRVHCWGAFTVGAETDGGRTTLELDLASDPSLPAAFRAR